MGRNYYGSVTSEINNDSVTSVESIDSCIELFSNNESFNGYNETMSSADDSTPKKNNSNNELEDLEVEVNNIMRNQKGSNDTRDMEIFKDLLSTLHDQIAALKEKVKFLRGESSHKSIMIDNMINVVRSLTKTEIYTYKSNNVDENNKVNHCNDKNITQRNGDRGDNTGNKVLQDINNSSNVLSELMSTPNVKAREKPQDTQNTQNHFSAPIKGVSVEDDKWDTESGEESYSFQNISTLSQYVTWKENRESSEAREEKTKPHHINSIYSKPLPKEALWKKGTTLVIGDSLLYGIDEKRMKNAKVRVYPGAGIEDMHYNILPLLRKKPTNIILHVGTNDTTSENSAEIIVKLLQLKNFILSILPNCKVIFSALIDRFDDNKSRLTVKLTNRNMESRGIRVIDNSNITREHLGKKGLHLNPKGTGKLAINIIRVLKSL